MAVDTVPDGFPAIPILATSKGDELYRFLHQAFEAQLLDRHGAPDGGAAFMTLRIGDTIISVMRPLEGEGTGSSLYVYVRDVDAVLQRATAAGARTLQGLTRAVHGDRMATVVDPFGNHWTIASRLEQITVEELHRRLAEPHRPPGRQPQHGEPGDPGNREIPPVRGDKHRALTAFLGRWRAEGQSYGSPAPPSDDPRSAAEPWSSVHTGRWHTGEFFLVQDERAVIGTSTFDTLSVMGVDATTGRHFARTFENHGFYRHYDVHVEGRLWTVTGETERAQIRFSDDGRTQTISWEWRPGEQWLPLCDRVARRDD